MFSTQLVNFAIGVILARLLSPEDFGLVGMITIFIAVSQIFINGGLNEALIRKVAISKDELNTAFLFNISASIVIYILLFLSSYQISKFYNQSELILIIRILAITLIINALGAVHQVQMIKKFQFKALAKISFGSTVFSGIVAVVVAICGFGVWSLVWKAVIFSIISTLFIWRINGWIPKFSFNVKVLKELFGFGGNLMLLGLIDTIYNNINYLIIGKVYSSAALGQYTRAEAFKQLPTQTITQIVQKVSYPVLSEIQENKNRLKEVYRKLVKGTMLITILSMFLLSSISMELVSWLLGAEWGQAGEYLQILCFSAIFFPLDALNSNILKVVNQSKLILQIGLIRKILFIPLIYIMVSGNILIFLYGLIIHQLVAFILISSSSKKYIDYSTIDQIKDIFPFVNISVLVYIILYLFESIFQFNNQIELVVKIGVGLFLSFLILELLRNETYLEIKSIVLSKAL